MTERISLSLTHEQAKYLALILDDHRDCIERDPERDQSPAHRAELDEAAAEVGQLHCIVQNALIAAGGAA